MYCESKVWNEGLSYKWTCCKRIVLQMSTNSVVPSHYSSSSHMGLVMCSSEQTSWCWCWWHGCVICERISLRRRVHVLWTQSVKWRPCTMSQYCNLIYSWLAHNAWVSGSPSWCPPFYAWSDSPKFCLAVSECKMLLIIETFIALSCPQSCKCWNVINNVPNIFSTSNTVHDLCRKVGGMDRQVGGAYRRAAQTDRPQRWNVIIYALYLYCCTWFVSDGGHEWWVAQTVGGTDGGWHGQWVAWMGVV